jgi:hypothetical protein
MMLKHSHLTFVQYLCTVSLTECICMPSVNQPLRSISLSWQLQYWSLTIFHRYLMNDEVETWLVVVWDSTLTSSETLQPAEDQRCQGSSLI